MPRNVEFSVVLQITRVYVGFHEFLNDIMLFGYYTHTRVNIYIGIILIVKGDWSDVVVVEILDLSFGQELALDVSGPWGKEG